MCLWHFVDSHCKINIFYILKHKQTCTHKNKYNSKLSNGFVCMLKKIAFFSVFHENVIYETVNCLKKKSYTCTKEPIMMAMFLIKPSSFGSLAKR